MDPVKENANRSWDKLLASVRGSFELFEASMEPASVTRFKIVRHQVEEAIYQARCSITEAPRKK
jgi:hypothetical protein